jgi:hypothetical protein
MRTKLVALSQTETPLRLRNGVMHGRAALTLTFFRSSILPIFC